MKKTYQERFNEIDLRDDYKEDVLNSVLHHEVKKEGRFSFKPRYLLAPLFALALLSVPFLTGNNVFGTKNSFIIEASDDYYKIEKSTIEILDSSLIAPDANLFNSLTGETWTEVFDAPLSIYFKGDTVKSVTYSIDNATFFKINEGYVDESGEGRTVQSVSLNGDNGYIAIGKEFQSYQVTNSDPAKNHWWYSYSDAQDGTLGNVGNRITINNEDQGTVQGLYGFSFKVMIEQNLLNRYTQALNDNDRMQAYEEIQKQVAETINRALLNVRIDYKDGTYETTQLKFHVHIDNLMQIGE